MNHGCDEGMLALEILDISEYFRSIMLLIDSILGDVKIYLRMTHLTLI